MSLKVEDKILTSAFKAPDELDNCHSLSSQRSARRVERGICGVND